HSRVAGGLSPARALAALRPRPRGGALLPGRLPLRDGLGAPGAGAGAPAPVPRPAHAGFLAVRRLAARGAAVERLPLALVRALVAIAGLSGDPHRLVEHAGELRLLLRGAAAAEPGRGLGAGGAAR